MPSTPADITDHHSNRSTLMRQAVTDSLPIFAAYFPLGLVWGVLWEQAGLPPVWGVAYSATVYAGAVQFIALSLLAADVSLWSLLVTVVPIAIRNSFYTMTALKQFPKRLLVRLYAAFGLVDANFAILMSKPIELARNPYYQIPLAIMTQGYWVVGTVIGIYSGGYIPNGIASLDFALPALLSVLAMEQYRKIRNWRPVAVVLFAAGGAWMLLHHSWLVPALIVCTIATIIMPTEEASS